VQQTGELDQQTMSALGIQQTGSTTGQGGSTGAGADMQPSSGIGDKEVSTGLLKVWMECRPFAAYAGGRPGSPRRHALTTALTASREARPAIGLLRLDLLVRHMAQHQSGQHDCDDQSGRKHPCLSPSTDAGSLIRILGAFGVKVVCSLF
jgi:hypothetical protein